MSRTRPTSPQGNPTIGIITALPIEYAAMKALLENQSDYTAPGQGAGRRYLLANVPSAEGGVHSVVLSLGDVGNNIAASRATLLLEHFPTVTSIIMVGIAGGVPNPDNPDMHVRLGDIVVSDRKGVVQYDFDKEDIYETTERHPPRPPSATLLEGVNLLRVLEVEGNHPWLKPIDRALKRLRVLRPAWDSDVLASSTDPTVKISHPEDKNRLEGQPRVFYGPIASANKLLKNPVKRDALGRKYGVRAIEMEGAGIADATWNHEAGYLVIRGISDYCDSTKGDGWQKYAAVVAAAYARAFLESLPVRGPGIGITWEHDTADPQKKPVKPPRVTSSLGIPDSVSGKSRAISIPVTRLSEAAEPKSYVAETVTQARWKEPQVLNLIESIQVDTQSLPSYVLEYLFPSSETILGPDGSCDLWWLAQNGFYARLGIFSQRIAQQTRGLIAQPDYLNINCRAFVWSKILLALADSQRARYSRSLSGLAEIDQWLSYRGFSESLAWSLNIKSIIAGKLGTEARAWHLATEAIRVAEDNGLFWLSTVIRLRMLHRSDWNAWEKGQIPDDSKFENDIAGSLLPLKYVGVNSRLHIEALVNAMETLHHSWKPADFSRAINTAQRAILLFETQVDHDENVRMISEIGRIRLKSLDDPTGAIGYFKRSAPLRLSSGHLNRLRYDLSWLAESYLKVEEPRLAALCATTALVVHRKLYGGRKTDSGLVRGLRKTLSKAGDSREAALNKDLASRNSELFGNSTGIDPVWWYDLTMENTTPVI